MSTLDRNSAPVMNRRGLLKCAAWAGAGVMWAMRAGALTSVERPDAAHAAAPPAASPQATAASARTVSIGNFAFSPADIEVPAGTRVTWSNDDDVPHKIVATNGGPVMKSPPLDTDQKYTAVLDDPGTYRYFCSFHPHMTGTIVVR